MKNILVPTDFSSNAYAALMYVSKLYAGENTHFTLLHSFEDEMSKLTSRVDIGKSDVVLDELYDSSDKEGKALMEKIKAAVTSASHSYEVISTPSPLYKAINKLVATEGIDLVVMGSKGRTGAEGVLMGSNTIKITQTLEGCPLLIVPREVYFVVPLNIAFSSDYNESFQLSKLKPITRLVRHYNSKIHLVHVGAEADLDETQQKNLEYFRNDLSEYDAEFHFIPKMGNISKSLHNFIDSEQINFFALVYHKHAFIKKLFREPVVSRVGKHTHVPTLVIPMKY